MDIAGLSMNLSQFNLSQAVGISILKTAQDTAVQQSQDLIKSLEQSVQPNLGRSLDIRI